MSDMNKCAILSAALLVGCAGSGNKPPEVQLGGMRLPNGELILTTVQEETTVARKQDGKGNLVEAFQEGGKPVTFSRAKIGPAIGIGTVQHGSFVDAALNPQTTIVYQQRVGELIPYAVGNAQEDSAGKFVTKAFHEAINAAFLVPAFQAANALDKWANKWQPDQVNQFNSNLNLNSNSANALSNASSFAKSNAASSATSYAPMREMGHGGHMGGGYGKKGFGFGSGD